MKRIIISTEDGRMVLLRSQDVISVWEDPKDEFTIVNFLQGERAMMLKTKEALQNLNVRLQDEP